jgi:FkbM family methyltransferase
MEDRVVSYNGMFWLKDDGAGVTAETASEDSSCWQLLNIYPDVPKKISEYVKERRIVIQAGGNNGLYAKQYAAMFDTVYTFEPVPELFYCLNRNITAENVFKFQACLGEKHALVGVGRKSYNNAGSTNVYGTGRTPTLRIDDLALDRCDLIHLDIEGFEMFALKGGEKTIAAYNPVIVLETAGWCSRYGVSEDDVISWLAQFGYERVGSVQGDSVFMVTRKKSEPHNVFSFISIPR